MERRILRPFRERGQVSRELTLLDFDADAYTRVATFDLPHGGVCIVEGVFLHREPFASNLDYSVYLEVNADVSFARVIARKVGQEEFSATAAKFFDRYLLSYMSYQRQHQPWRRADIIVDNNSPADPHVVLEPDFSARWPL